MQTIQFKTSVKPIRPTSMALKEKTNLKNDPNYFIHIYLYINCLETTYTTMIPLPMTHYFHIKPDNILFYKGVLKEENNMSVLSASLKPLPQKRSCM